MTDHQRLEEIKGPERIWLQYWGDDEPSDEPVSNRDATWCLDRIFDHDIEYVQAAQLDAANAERDALKARVEELEERIRRMGESASQALEDQRKELAPYSYGRGERERGYF